MDYIVASKFVSIFVDKFQEKYNYNCTLESFQVNKNSIIISLYDREIQITRNSIFIGYLFDKAFRVKLEEKPIFKYENVFKWAILQYPIEILDLLMDDNRDGFYMANEHFSHMKDILLVQINSKKALYTKDCIYVD